jgi:HSP20 family protein
MTHVASIGPRQRTEKIISYTRSLEMAIKVQVKENGTSKVQPNLFNNGAAMGVNSSDFVGVQPASMNGFGTWTTPASNAWNTPMTGINTMNTTPSFSNTTSLPYARQNAYLGQLPGMWQGEIAAQMTSPVAVNPWFSGLNPQVATLANGITPGVNYVPTTGLPVGSSFSSPVAAGTFGLNSMNPSGQQAAMASQSVAAHLPIDVLDNGSQYLLVADLPGVKIDDLELTIENGLLMIKAVSQATTFVPGIDMTTPVTTISREKAAVKIYQRAFAIGRDVTVENITSSLSSGVLTITLPKVNMVSGTPSRIRNSVVAA